MVKWFGFYFVILTMVSQKQQLKQQCDFKFKTINNLAALIASLPCLITTH